MLRPQVARLLVRRCAGELQRVAPARAAPAFQKPTAAFIQPPAPRPDAAATVRVAFMRPTALMLNSNILHTAAQTNSNAPKLAVVAQAGCPRGFGSTPPRMMSAPGPKKVGYQASQAIPDFIDSWGRESFFVVGGFGIVSMALTWYLEGWCQQTGVLTFIVALYWVLGIRDLNQNKHTILRNFPVLGRIRYVLEVLRPEIRQYFIESDSEAVPFTREQRDQVYKRAKNLPDTIPFGTRKCVYSPGYEWVLHSMNPKVVDPASLRTLVGNKDCKQPYSASILNVSGMSYGALSDNAILALNGGAKLGNFYHNTGEGGMSRFHLQPGGDLVWNIGTGYFGCRNKDGTFSPEMFADNAARPQLKMVEIKLSQGAKPAHGGMLPKAKITHFIAEARGVEMGEDCNSPPKHSAFHDADSLIMFVAQLRELSGGKPVGFKLCLGLPEEFASVVHAMLKHDTYPDFITIDGAEGGTGAAPPEFSNHVGMPMIEALVFVDSMLQGAGIREHIKLIASGKIYNGFTTVRALALGADICNSARAMMFAIGCIQALKCNTNHCPTGVATQDKRLMEGLVVSDKEVRVYNFHHKAIEVAGELIGAIGIEDHTKLARKHVVKRISESQCRSYAEIYPNVVKGSLLEGTAPERLQDAFSVNDDFHSMI